MLSIGSDALPIVVAVLLPLIGALGVACLGRWPDVRDGFTVVVGLGTFASVTRLFGPVMDGARPALDLPQWMPGLGLGFEVEPLGLLFALIALGFVTAFLHYALDRAVFRLSDKEVRGAAHNLLDHAQSEAAAGTAPPTSSA